MARRCICDLIRRMIEGDPRLCGIAPLARFLFQELAHKADGWGGIIPTLDMLEISMMVRFPKPDVETHLQTLLKRGVIVREGETLVFPSLRDDADARAARSARARENASRFGGRPLKGETKEQARLRRAQASLVLPITGGRAETQETQRETSRASDSDSVTENQIRSDARETQDVAALAVECAEAAGIAPHTGHRQNVRAWLQRGLSPDEILSTIRTVTERALSSGRQPGSLNYFDGQMPIAVPAQATPAAPTHPETAAWLAAVEAWKAAGRPGPMPAAPAHLRRDAA